MIKTIEKLFENRNVINIANTGTLAIPLDNAEVDEIKIAFNKRIDWRKLKFNRMVAIGSISKPTRLILDLIPFIEVTDINHGNTKRSYFYPPLNRPTTNDDNVIVYEDSRSVWKHYAHILTKKGRKEVLIYRAG